MPARLIIRAIIWGADAARSGGALLRGGLLLLILP
jgi:hypothetical protein